MPPMPSTLPTPMTRTTRVLAVASRSVAPVAERQLALPLEPTSRPSRPPRLPVLGPPMPPRRVWRSLAASAQAAVRRTLTQIGQELTQPALSQLAQEDAHDAAPRP